MRYEFKKITLHNFLSFGDAEIDLQDKGYCLIRGVNKNPLDRALSNGSGKSTIISSISWCLTGETVQGVKSNIENKFTSGGCFVELIFNVDRDSYKVTRYKNHEKFKTHLKIIKNGEDISGKGIKESSIILAQHLPELTTKLLASVILLGQGLPNSFTKNSPSGRKETLEQLTGSDFMIELVREKVNNRLNTLNNLKRDFEDAILKINSKNDYALEQKTKVEEKLNNCLSINFDEEIAKLTLDLSTITTNNNELENQNSKLDARIEELTNELLCLSQNKQNDITKINEEYSSKIEIARNNYFESKNSLDALKSEYTKLSNIKDICPTCNQKIPNVFKPDTTSLQLEIARKEQVLSNDTTTLNNMSTELNEKINKIKADYNSKEVSLNSELSKDKQEKLNLTSKININKNNISNLQLNITKLNSDKSNNENNILELKQQLVDLNKDIETYATNLLYNNTELEKLQQHIDIVNKMSTLVKRDFRGYLLTNIIKYVESKSKEYCKYIFNSDDLKIELNGNDIDILFSNKDFESLSGGEKQKVDVVIQFAIRDMMSKYLDFKSNILFLDEITDNLDSLGCTGLFNLISNTLIDLESIFIISHHESELTLPIDTEIVVEKNNLGISRVM